MGNSDKVGKKLATQKKSKNACLLLFSISPPFFDNLPVCVIPCLHAIKFFYVAEFNSGNPPSFIQSFNQYHGVK